MLNLFLRLLAKFLAQPVIANRLINRAIRTPYDHLIVQYDRVYRVSHDADLDNWPHASHWYMRRYWLFRCGPLQARIHHILSADPGRDLHNHPWAWRTFILHGWYAEDRLAVNTSRSVFIRKSGDTSSMGRNDYHRISEISEGGAWTLFVTFGRPKGWCFRVAGEEIPHEKYHG